MMCVEHDFVNVWDEVALFQTTNEATNRNVIYNKHNADNGATTAVIQQ